MSSLRRSALLVLLAASAAVGQSAPAGPSPFLVKPYLQLGDSPSLGETETYALLWHTDSVRADWRVEVRLSGSAPWTLQPTFNGRLVNVPGTPTARGLEPHYVYEGTLGSPKPGGEFEYRVLRNGTVVFQAPARARKARTQTQRFVVFGDAGANTPGQKAIA